MINEIIINGSKETTFFDFTFTASGMNIAVSPGTYYKNGQTVFTDVNGGTITIPTTANMNYDICLLETGISVVQYALGDDPTSYYDSNSIIDMLAWLTVPENTTTLDNVQINVKAMVNA